MDTISLYMAHDLQPAAILTDELGKASTTTRVQQTGIGGMGPSSRVRAAK